MSGSGMSCSRAKSRANATDTCIEPSVEISVSTSLPASRSSGPVRCAAVKAWYQCSRSRSVRMARRLSWKLRPLAACCRRRTLIAAHAAGFCEICCSLPSVMSARPGTGGSATKPLSCATTAMAAHTFWRVARRSSPAKAARMSRAQPASMVRCGVAWRIRRCICATLSSGGGAAGCGPQAASARASSPAPAARCSARQQTGAERNGVMQSNRAVQKGRPAFNVPTRPSGDRPPLQL